MSEDRTASQIQAIAVAINYARYVDDDNRAPTSVLAKLGPAEQWACELPNGQRYALKLARAAMSALVGTLHEEGGAQPSPNAPSEDYNRGWDDCLERVFKAMMDKFPRAARRVPDNEATQ